MTADEVRERILANFAALDRARQFLLLTEAQELLAEQRDQS